MASELQRQSVIEEVCVLALLASLFCLLFVATKSESGGSRRAKHLLSQSSIPIYSFQELQSSQYKKSLHLRQTFL